MLKVAGLHEQISKTVGRIIYTIIANPYDPFHDYYRSSLYIGMYE